MSDKEIPEEKRLRDLTPQPRKPIHSDMGRYGMNKLYVNRHESATHSDLAGPGIDVVDNIMSKMSPIHVQTSPLPVKKRIGRRSFSQSDENEYSEDDSNNLLSKSLPANLPSHLYSSDDSDYENDELSCTPIISRNNSGCYSRNNSDLQSSTFDHLPYNARSEGPPKKNIGIYLLLAIVISVIALSWQFLYVTKSTQNKASQTVNYENEFETKMDNLKEKYNIDANSILKIKTGVSTIFSRKDAGSFIFLYNSQTDNFDPMGFDKFINEVALTSARYLRNNITPVHHIVVVSSSLDMQEHGELISRYRDDVYKNGVMLVKEVDAVPSELAMAFHYYCDEYDPLVKGSAIFFTLNLANCSDTADKKSTYDFIEKCLARKWKSVPPENIRPLLTRIVDIIIDVTRVF